MPVRRGHDSRGPFYRWGTSGKKYHYASGDPPSRARARARAARQGRAIAARRGAQK